MTNLEKLYETNMGFQSVVDSLAIWFCDETEHVGGGELHDWMLADSGEGAAGGGKPYSEARDYARRKAEAGDRLAATAYVIGYCDGTGADMWAMLADCGLGLHGAQE